MYDESLGFYTEYFAWYPHTRCQMWDVNEEEVDSEEILVGCNNIKRLTQEDIKFIHEYVITNSTTRNVAHR